MKKLTTLAGGMLAVALLSGCASAATTEATPKPTPAESTRPTTSVAPTATPLPTEESTATELDCTAAVTQAGHDNLAADGLTLREPSTDWAYPVLQRIAGEGVLCKWSTTGDVQVIFGQLAMSEAEWTAVRAGLIEDGFVEDDSLVPGFLDGPDEVDPDYPHRGVLYRDGILYYSSYPGFFEFVTAFQV